MAGPISKGDFRTNIRQAIETGNKLAEWGYAPYIPHINMVWELLYPHGGATNDEHGFWLGQEMEWLRTCDVLFRLTGESKGADLEVKRARELGIPVVTDSDLIYLLLKYPAEVPYYEDSQTETEQPCVEQMEETGIGCLGCPYNYEGESVPEYGTTRTGEDWNRRDSRE